MALSTALVWEVRTTGSDNNGGAFKTGASGTDYSQQDSPQWALTGVTSSGAGAVFLTAQAAASMVGNTVRVVSGTNFTVGTYEITSVSVGVSVTVDRNLTTGAGSSGVLNIGGALATIGAATGRWAAENLAWVKATADYTVTATVTLASGLNDIGNIAPNQLTGYTSVRGDNGQATIKTSTNNLALMTVAMNNAIISNFVFDSNSTTTSRGIAITGANPERGARVVNCTAKNFTSRGFSVESGQASGPVFYRCYATAGSTAASGGFGFSGGYCGTFIDCVASGNSCHGFSFGSNNCSATFTRCIAAGNKTGGTYHGFNLAAALGHTLVSQCVAYDNSGSGISFGGSYGSAIVENCILVSNGAYGLTWAATQRNASLVWNYNAFYNNTSGARNNVIAGANDVTLTGSPFTDAAAGDFSLNNTAGAGAACRAAGHPGLLPNGLTTGYLDIGAVQHQDSGGSGGGLLVNPGLSGGLL